MEESLLIDQFVLGPWDNFIYIIGDRDTGRCAVVDPAWHGPTILRRVEALGFKLTDILCTHSHVDHVNAVEAVRDATDARVHMLREEVAWSGFQSESLVIEDAGAILSLGANLKIRLIHTPGHTPGSTSYLLSGRHFKADALLTGDTLFVDGCGRCDFVGGDPQVMYGTLNTLTTALPGDTVVLPGHHYGPTERATLEDQRGSNPFLLKSTLADFVTHRMAGKTPNTILPEPGPWSPSPGSD